MGIDQVEGAILPVADDVSGENVLMWLSDDGRFNVLAFEDDWGYVGQSKDIRNGIDTHANSKAFADFTVVNVVQQAVEGGKRARENAEQRVMNWFKSRTGGCRADGGKLLNRINSFKGETGTLSPRGFQQNFLNVFGRGAGARGGAIGVRIPGVRFGGMSGTKQR